MRNVMQRIAMGLVLLLLFPLAWADEAIWEQLRSGGYILLMRHAQTEPGVGDPSGFSLGDCKTQRNLSDEGRAQARRTGEALRKRGIALSEVRSSAWCRCVDTAMLAFGKATVWPALNSFFDAPERKNAKTREVLSAMRSVNAPRNMMLVTHQVNISALTGYPAASGEVVVTKTPTISGERLIVVGRLNVP
jgi:phosphohistidine phosphatase SixA